MCRRVSFRIDTLDIDSRVVRTAPNVRFWHTFAGRLVRLTLVPGQVLRVTVDGDGYHRTDNLSYNGRDVFHSFRRELFDAEDRLIQVGRFRMAGTNGGIQESRSCGVRSAVCLPRWESIQDAWRVFTREEAGY